MTHQNGSIKNCNLILLSQGLDYRRKTVKTAH
jgi:hypothetical protein